MNENLELREWLAVNVFGYKLRKRVLLGGVPSYGDHWTEPNGKSWRFGLPDFVGTYDGMGAVIERMEAKGFTMNMQTYSDGAIYVDFRTPEAFGKHAGRTDKRLAVALAAKAAIESETK